MDKLYYIVCEEKGETLFEGRFQGRTRGAALKFLKEQIGRQHLNGTVFTITEIPVTVIREIVQEILSGKVTALPVPVAAEPELQAESEAQPEPVPQPEEEPQSEATGQPDWNAVKAFYKKTRSPKQTAETFGITINTVNGRARRGGW